MAIIHYIILYLVRVVNDRFIRVCICDTDFFKRLWRTLYYIIYTRNQAPDSKIDSGREKDRREVKCRLVEFTLLINRPAAPERPLSSAVTPAGAVVPPTASGFLNKLYLGSEITLYKNIILNNNYIIILLLFVLFIRGEDSTKSPPRPQSYNYDYSSIIGTTYLLHIRPRQNNNNL